MGIKVEVDGVKMEFERPGEVAEFLKLRSSKGTPSQAVVNPIVRRKKPVPPRRGRKKKYAAPKQMFFHSGSRCLQLVHYLVKYAGTEEKAVTTRDLCKHLEVKPNALSGITGRVTRTANFHGWDRPVIMTKRARLRKGTKPTTLWWAAPNASVFLLRETQNTQKAVADGKV